MKLNCEYYELLREFSANFFKDTCRIMQQLRSALEIILPHRYLRIADHLHALDLLFHLWSIAARNNMNSLVMLVVHQSTMEHIISIQQCF